MLSFVVKTNNQDVCYGEFLSFIELVPSIISSTNFMEWLEIIRSRLIHNDHFKSYWGSAGMWEIQVQSTKILKIGYLTSSSVAATTYIIGI
ncbi:unnamed protein product [Cuscuta campestris]|uniref:Uncharacterized protein n=1 Tax=Cuscuta campestris TaxID=132261 RepID=A0A484M6C8_9ASTE|nr:unnamed protein product [Cuscuta campestris]